MKRPPFIMSSARHAALTCDGKFVTAGRASFVWETYLMRRACGVPGDHKIKRGERGAPSHTLDFSIEDAEEALREWGIFGPRRIALARKSRESRAARGLPVA